MLSDELNREYESLTANAGFVELESPTILKMEGGDRRKFLHSFCTADINALEDGKTSEAFVLNEKGKVLGHVNVLALPDRLELVTTPNQYQVLFPHLDRYNFREDVAMSDKSEGFSYFVCGKLAAAKIAALIGRELAENETCIHSINGHEAVLAHIELGGFGFFIHALVEKPLTDFFSESEFARCSPDALNIVRVENATPKFGQDVTEENLPQEIQRDELTISFTKGCYLGQETVARIDALGRVNRLLTPLKLSEKCEAGTKLQSNEKMVGLVTSIAWSPRESSWLALGYVRRNSLNDELSFEWGKKSGLATKI